MALAACEGDAGFARFDDKQKRVIRALCDESVPHVLVTGGAGSGKTPTVNFAVKKLALHNDVRVIRVAVSDLTAERFGGGDAVNLMLFFSILDSFCGGRTHYAAQENPAVDGFLKGLARGRALVAIDEFGLMSAANLTRTVTLLWRACGKVSSRFARVQLVLIGDPGGQMPPISGESVVFSSVFKDHPSGYARRLFFARLEGQHRFSLSAREHMHHLLTCDATSREQFLTAQKARYARDPAPHLKITLLRSRKGCEPVIRRMADHRSGDGPCAAVNVASPEHVIGTRKENDSKFTPGSFLLPRNDDVIIIEVTAWSNRIFGVGREDPEAKVRVHNRQRFYVSSAAFHDVLSGDGAAFISPPRQLGKDAPSITVMIDGAEYGIPLFVKSAKDDCTVLAIRQVGFATPNDAGDGYDALGMAFLLFNAQGDQFPGKTIVIGSDCDATSGSVLRLADFCVGVSRTSDPKLCLFHPSVKIYEAKQETDKYKAIKKALKEIEETVMGKKRAGQDNLTSQPAPQRRRSKFSSSVCAAAVLRAGASQQDVFW